MIVGALSAEIPLKVLYVDSANLNISLAPGSLRRPNLVTMEAGPLSGVDQGMRNQRPLLFFHFWKALLSKDFVCDGGCAMNIGAAKRASGLSTRTIRYYEEIGLSAPARRANGYREYTLWDVHKLAFLKRARGLGFSIEDCRVLLSLYEDKNRASADVRALANKHLNKITTKLVELEDMRYALAHLVDACHGYTRPDCPIIDNLAGTNVADK